MCMLCVWFFRVFVKEKEYIKPHNINFHTTHLNKKKSHISCINTRPSQRTKHCDITGVTNVHTGAFYSYLCSRYRYCFLVKRLKRTRTKESERVRGIKTVAHTPTIFYHIELCVYHQRIVWRKRLELDSPLSGITPLNHFVYSLIEWNKV